MVVWSQQLVPIPVTATAGVGPVMTRVPRLILVLAFSVLAARASDLALVGATVYPDPGSPAIGDGVVVLHDGVIPRSGQALGQDSSGRPRDRLLGNVRHGGFLEQSPSHLYARPTPSRDSQCGGSRSRARRNAEPMGLHHRIRHRLGSGKHAGPSTPHRRTGKSEDTRLYRRRTDLDRDARLRSDYLKTNHIEMPPVLTP